MTLGKFLTDLTIFFSVSLSDTINNELFIFDDVKKEIKKTKIFNSFLVKNNLTNVLIVSDKVTEKNIVKSVRNLPNVKLINEAGTNVYDLVKYKNVLFTTTSIKNIQDRLK